MALRSSFVIRTLHAELLDLCLAQRYAALPLSVSFTKKTVRGNLYHYAQYQDLELGRQRQLYLGPDTPALCKRIADYQERQAVTQNEAKPRRELVRALLAAGGAAPDARSGRLLEFLEEVGVFKAGGAIVGSHALGSYVNQLGVRFDQLHTEDVDVASTLQLAMTPSAEPLEAKLREYDADFLPVPSLGRSPSTSYSVRGGTLRLDILAPLIGPPRTDPIRIPAFGTYAAPLRFLDYLTETASPSVILYGSGILVNVPLPERYALHKLVLASYRARAFDLKAEKDLKQAEGLLFYFANEDPYPLKDAFEALAARGDGALKYLYRSAIHLESGLRDQLAALTGDSAWTSNKLGG